MRFEDDSVLRLYKQTIQDFCLYPGLELTPQQYDALLKAASEMSAKMRAVRIVSATNVSARDLEQRLIRKGEDPVHAREAVSWMEDLSLLDDRKTAQQIVDRCIAKGYGVSRAKQALYEKRIPKELWDEVLEDYPDQTDKILAYLQMKLPDLRDEKAVRKVTDALLRRGHSYSQIRSAMRQLDVELQEEF